MNILILTKIACAIAILALLGVLHHHIYQSGADNANAKWEKRIAEDKADSLAKAKLAEQTLASNMAEIDNRYKEIHDAKAQLLIDRSKLRSVRVSVPVTHFASSVAPAACLGEGTGTAELDQPLAGAIFNIAADGDAAIKQMNIRLGACVDAYDSASRLP